MKRRPHKLFKLGFLLASTVSLTASCASRHNQFSTEYANTEGVLVPTSGTNGNTISVGMTRTETLRRLMQSGAVEVPKAVLPDAKGWAVADRHDCLFLSFANDVLVRIEVESNADKPKRDRGWYATQSYGLP